jgi:hypothetical protein
MEAIQQQERRGLYLMRNANVSNLDSLTKLQNMLIYLKIISTTTFSIDRTENNYFSILFE